MTIGLISNMYPSKRFPVFGIFVKNIEVLLNECGIKTIDKAVIYKKESKLIKFQAYILFYLKSIYILIFSKVELVYIHFPLQISPLLNLLSFFHNKHVVLNIHGSELNKSSIFHNSFIKTLKKASLIVVPSMYYSNRIINEYNIDENKLYIYPSGGIDRSLFEQKNKLNLRKKHNLPLNSFICSYISSIFEEKGWRVFLEASKLIIKQNKEIIFLVVGNGVQETEFKELVKKNKLSENYYFFDRQAQKELVEFYNCSDLFIFPTYRDEESLGLVGLEALACGIPVIGSKLGAIKDYIVNKKNGYLFDKKNEKQLVGYVFEYYFLKEKHKMIDNAINTAKLYDSKNCTKEFANKLKELD